VATVINADGRTLTLRDGHGGLLLAGGVFVAASGQIQAITMLWMSQPMNATTITRERDLARVRP